MKQYSSVGSLVESIAVQSTSNIIKQDDRLDKIVLSLVWVVVGRMSARPEIINKDSAFIYALIKSFSKTAQTINQYIKYAPKLESLHDIETSPDVNDEQTFVKYHIDSYLCKCFDDPELPIKSDIIGDNQLFSGLVKRYVNRLLLRRDLSFFYSLQKGTKKIWPSLGKRKWLDAIKSHAITLKQKKDPIESDIIREIQSTTEFLFGGLSNSECQKFMPSGSACLQATREKGGTLSLFPKVKMSKDSFTSLGTLRDVNNKLTGWRQNSLNLCFQKVAEDLRDSMESSDPYKLPTFQRNDIVLLPEPGKFRVISKGDGYLYTALQPLQDGLLSRWKKSKYSTMLLQDIGSILSSWLSDIKSYDFSDEEMVWNSGDYEKATDKQKKDATFAVVETLTRLEVPLHELAALSFQPSVLHYPRITFDEPEVEKKTFIDSHPSIYGVEGQLMGHPLSFPFLCTINLSVYFAALKRWRASYGYLKGDAILRKQRQYEFLRGHVLVNGDDILFYCPRSLLKFFFDCANQVGFTKSIGKNYVSKDMCMINSQVFVMSGDIMYRRGYLNLNLLYGLNVKKQDTFEVQKVTGAGLGKEISEMCLLADWTRCALPFAMTRFDKLDEFRFVRKLIRTNKKKRLMPLTEKFKPNWFLPLHLGGFGIDVRLASDTWHISNSQRLVATYFIHNPRLSLYYSKGIMMDQYLAPQAFPEIHLMSEDVTKDQVKFHGTTFFKVDEAEEGWGSRFAYLARAEGMTDSGLRAVARKDFGVSSFEMIGNYRLSIREILQYWKPNFYVSALPVCPPLPLMKLPKFNSSFKTSRNWKSFEIIQPLTENKWRTIEEIVRERKETNLKRKLEFQRQERVDKFLEGLELPTEDTDRIVIEEIDDFILDFPVQYLDEPNEEIYNFV